MHSQFLRFISILAWMLLSFSFAHAQPKGDIYESEIRDRIDSISALIRTTTSTDTDSARSLIANFDNWMNTNANELQGYTLLLEAIISYEENNQATGNQLSDDAQAIFDNTNDHIGTLELLHTRTINAVQSSEYPEALEWVFKSISVAEEAEAFLYLAKAFNQVSDILWYQAKWDESLDYAIQASDILTPLGPSEELALSYKLMSDANLQIADYQTALDNSNASIAMKESLGLPPLAIARAINSRGNVYKYMERYDDAISDYAANLRLCDSLGYERCTRVALANLGHVSLLNEDYHSTIDYELRSIAIQRRTGQDQQISENLMHLTEAYAGIGDYNSAYEYQQQLADVIDEEHEQDLNSLSSELATKYETLKKEEVIDDMGVRLQMKDRTLLLGGTILLISLIGGLVAYFLLRKLKAKNRENEILLKEIHHRVKNNLQILSSLLSLQSDNVQDPSAIDALTEGRNRVESMGLIHQRLYTLDNITSVNIKAYVSELSRFLEDSFSTDKREIKILEDITYGNMDIDYSIPLGLIINELVTNAVKYAFAGLEYGELQISLKEEGGKLVLSVADQGSPHEVDINPGISTSFGTKLVKTLCKKLKGEIKIDTSKGYRTVITFSRYKKTV